MGSGFPATPEQVKTILEGRANGVMVKDLKNQTGLTGQTIWKISKAHGLSKAKGTGRTRVKQYTVEVPYGMAREFEKWMKSRNGRLGYKSKSGHIVACVQYAMEWMDDNA